MVQQDSSGTSKATTVRDIRKELDRQVGARIRNLRVLKGWSPLQLGEAIGCTAEQIRKIERGALRIDPGKLIALSSALDSEVDGFFDNLDGPPTMATATTEGVPTDFVARRDVSLLVSAFSEIDDTNLRSSFLRVAERMATLKSNKK